MKYIPPGGRGGGTINGPQGRSGSGSAGGSSSGGDISAIDILELSNAGDTNGIVAIFQPTTSTGGDETPGPRTVVLNAAAIGMPSDGTATLSITGRGINYEVTATVGADGNVTFEVPAIVTGTEVTVALVIKTAGGAVLFSGSKTQVLTGDSSSLNISLSRQYWAMPASISAAASPDTLEYDPATLDSESTTFSIIGLSDAPAGVSYSWTDESGTVVGTGATLTRTVNEMLGAGFMPMNDSEERTYTVTASYTDASGAAKTLTASATATVVTTATIRLTASGIQSEGGRQFIVIPKTTSSVPITAEVLCFAGTPTYTWSNVGVGFTSFVPAGGDSNNIGGPWDGGKATITVQADLGDGRTLTRELDVYVLEARISGADVPSVATDPIVISDAATDSALLTARLWETGSDLAGLSGVEYAWEVDDMLVATANPAGAASTTILPVGTGNTTVKATISYKGVSVEATRSLVVAGLSITGDEVMVKGATGKSLSASVTGFVGTPTVSSWNWGSGSGTVASLTGTDTSSVGVNPLAGGKSTVTVSAVVGGRTFTKSVDVYVLDVVLGGSGLPAATTDPIVIVNSATGSAALNMSLAGFASAPSGTSYEWVIADETLASTSTPLAATATIVPHDTGTTTVKAKISYRGVTAESATRTINVAGLKITGDAVLQKGGTAVTLGATVQGFTTPPTVSSWSWAWKAGAASLATITNPDSSTPSLASATAGGKTTLTVSAVVGGVTLTAEKDIYVLELEVSAPEGCETDASGNPKLNYGGTLDLTASLTGLTAADLTGLGTVSYSWSSGDATATPPEPAKALFTPDNAASTAASPISGDSAPVPLTVTLSWTGNATAGIAAGSMDASIDVSTPAEVALTNLADYLASLPANDKDHPYKIPNITGLKFDSSAAGARQLDALKTAGRYVDLSDLVLEGTEADGPFHTFYNGTFGMTIASMPLYSGHGLFWDNDYIVELPTLSPPSGSKLALGNQFSGCGSITTIRAGAIPSNTYAFTEAFYHCTGLVDASALVVEPTTLGMDSCFEGCTKLTAIPDTISNTKSGSDYAHTLNLQKCFKDCTSLVDASNLTISGNVRTMYCCFQNCTKLTTPPTINLSTARGSSSEGEDWINLRNCFEGCTKLTSLPTITSSSTCDVNFKCSFKDCTSLGDVSTFVFPDYTSSLESCFEGCTSLTTPPSMPSTYRRDFSMESCFKGCSNLTTAPEIGGSSGGYGVNSMKSCFEGCTSLTGVVNVTSTKASLKNASYWTDAFKGVLPSQGVIVKVPDADVKAAVMTASGNSGVTVYCPDDPEYASY